MNFTVTTKEDCLNIALTINRGNDPEISQYTKEEKYKLYLAKEYFQKNMDNFSEEEIKTVSENLYLVKNIKNIDVNSLLNNAIKQQKSSVIPLVKHFNSQLSKSKKEEYFKILNNEDNKNELNLFFERDPIFSEALCNKLPFLCDTLIEKMSPKDFKFFLIKNNWDVEKKIEWLNNNKSTINFDKLFMNNQLITEQENGMKEKIFKIVIEEMEQRNNKEFTKQMLESCAEDFLIYLKDNKKELLDKFMNSYFQHKSINMNFNAYTTGEEVFEENVMVKGVQYLALNRICKSNSIVDVFEVYQEELLEEIETHIKLYIKSVHPLEYALSKENFEIFSLLNFEKLKEEDKHISIAAAFTYFILENKTSYLDEWCFNTITKCDNSWFEVYKEKCTALGIEEDKLKDLQSISMFRSLQKDIPEKNEIKNNKMKI